MTNKEIDIFENRPVLKSILSLAIPTVISQLITVLYNTADTFFIGQIGDPNQVAAANLCMPFFFFLNAIANLFGIGGASLVSRLLGSQQYEKAKKTSSFTIWSALVCTLFYSIIILFTKSYILPLLGANNLTQDFSETYVFYVICLGGIPTVFNVTCAHLVRSEGFSKQASFGMILGAVLNIVIDPIFIMVLKMEIMGAAIATLISNVVASLFFIVYLLKKKEDTYIKLNPKYYSVKEHIPREVILTGLPSAALSILVAFSNLTINKLMSEYGNEAIAAMGIARKIDLVTMGISLGISQGVVPLIGYNYASKNYKRMKKAIKETFFIIMGFAFVSVIVLFTFAKEIVGLFIDDALTVQYGEGFQKIFALSGIGQSSAVLFTGLFQAVGKKVQPFIISTMRKGVVDIPFMFILNNAIGINGIVWAMPIADTFGMILSIILFVPFWIKLNKLTKEKQTKVSLN